MVWTGILCRMSYCACCIKAQTDRRRTDAQREISTILAPPSSTGFPVRFTVSQARVQRNGFSQVHSAGPLRTRYSGMNWRTYHDFSQHTVDVNLKGRVHRTLLQEVFFFSAFTVLRARTSDQQWISCHEIQFLFANTIRM